MTEQREKNNSGKVQNDETGRCNKNDGELLDGCLNGKENSDKQGKTEDWVFGGLEKKKVRS